ncbi:hypothetical protein JR316_0000310 [Psilocybe cubensis]|uniref:Uncharacterized protein n=2 Tax=Psilocybe cubensis TaxID=181762 RepID=A0A8H8CQ50_PSICU|nr:hypothetical protein JR316_0000310 [Psilocybe cubensis]KAH9486246.1 hypothetical protein JR316_0000310 [Psilocybe cubensis]
MTPKTKRQKVDKTILEPVPKTGQDFDPPVREGTREDVSNSEKGLLSLPVELRTEIIGNLLKITVFTETPQRDPVLPAKYRERTSTLRALSQVCVAYRREYLPALWEQLNICWDIRGIVIGASALFHINIGKALDRNCDGLAISPHLRPHIRTANIVLTRYKAATSIPKFRALLHSLENLHTLYLLHTHTQLGKFLNQTFHDGVTFPQIRTLAIQGYCQHILRCCPNLTTLWCNIEEIRGFSGDEKIIAGLTKAAPNLRVFEVWDTNYSSFLQHLPSFKNFTKLIIKTSSTYIDQHN